MTSARDPVDPDVDQQAPRTDDLEDWLTDLRANLDNDPPGWLVPEQRAAEDADEQLPDPPAWPPSAGDRPQEDRGAAARAEAADNGSPDHPQRPAVGRHRAAD